MQIPRSLLLPLLLGACGGGGGAAPAASPTASLSTQEQQCVQAGWQRETVASGGLSRPLFWKAPTGPWTRGALLVMHGGGGSYTNFCVANVELIAPQVRFTQMALERGFAVFLLDSTDQVTDTAGRLCGKVWDDEVRNRDNLDLPYLEAVLRNLLPARRPSGSRSDVFVTGHSSGGYMAVRAASRLGDAITAIAPVSSGDPYGWFRDCTPRAGDRPNVFGAGFDNETRRQIIEPDACSSGAYPGEKPWDSPPGGARPVFRVFHHAQDGINDRSCVEKVRTQLQARGYPESAPFTLDGGSRSADVHYWLDAYNAPLLDWLASKLGS